MTNYYKLILKCLENINRFNYKLKIIKNIKYVNILKKKITKHINYYIKNFICVLVKSNPLLKYLLFFPLFIIITCNYISFKISEYNSKIKIITNIISKQENKKIFLHVNLINAWKKWYYITIQLSKILRIIKKNLLSTNNYIVLHPLYKINFFTEK
ncbi:hypothetical protein MACK_004179 (apicoplast) [Theileria orientalis]|uniref:Uncharacterized protein n=1 Tax=Theileria orientalis TaxID=68886 RepID=A0A976SIA9_THEOR|nr:hypothetical protein MACK_004179 [Theileria orientalis]